MANPTDLTIGRSQANEAIGGGELGHLRQEFNKLVTNLRVLTAKLDADAGVTDTNYGALVTDSAVSGPAKINMSVG